MHFAEQNDAKGTKRLLGDVGLGLDEDTVKELTDILVLDEALLVELGALLGQDSQIVALNDELILDLGVLGTADGNTLGEVQGADALLAQEVTDLNTLSLAGDTDGEMGVGETQLELVSLGDSGDHVADGGQGGVDACGVGLGAEPADNGEGVLVDTELELHVLHALGQGTAGAGNGDGAALGGALDTGGDVEAVGGLDLHFGCSNKVQKL